MFSTLRIVGGDFELGLAIELPLPLLEDFLLFPCFNLVRWKFIKLLTAGDCPSHPFPGLALVIAPNGAATLFTCGVVRIESSISSASITSSSPEVLSEESDAIMFTLPKELETAARSAFARVDHRELELLLRESAVAEK
jgi:hypothetical protein